MIRHLLAIVFLGLACGYAQAFRNSAVQQCPSVGSKVPSLRRDLGPPYAATARMAFEAFGFVGAQGRRPMVMGRTWTRLEATTSTVIGAHDKTWYAVFKRLEDYKKQHGNVNVPHRHNDGGTPHLGQWLRTQRRKYKKGSLSEDKISKLEALGVKWYFDSQGLSQQMRDEGQWSNTYARLLQYKEEFGNVTVPIYYNDGETPHLGEWVMTQRMEFKIFKKTEGKAGSITQERIDKLNSMGFVWEDVKQAELDQQWLQSFEKLVEFKKKYNSTKVPKAVSKFEDPLTVLGEWAHEQRTQFAFRMKNTTSSMTQERMEMLDSIGFSWTLQNRTDHEKWLLQYFKLYFHHRQYNNTIVVDSDAYNSRFVNWVARQKVDYHKGNLDQLKIELLNELNFDWELDPEPSWDDNYLKLCEYHAKYSTTLLNIRINSNLAAWCEVQRALYKKGLLEMERVAKLNMLHFDWDPDDADWNAMFHRLLAYRREHGDVLVHAKYVGDPPLGTWVDNQRTKYSRFCEGHEHVGEMLIKQVATRLATKRLPAEKHEARLTSLVGVGFVWSAQKAQWLEMYQRLLEYKHSTNSTLVPNRYKKDPQLGEWVAGQRTRALEGLISARQVQLLDQIGFVWDPIGDRWNEMFERLCEYKSQNGDANVPYGYSSDKELGRWVYTQRRFYREKRLLEERISKLESIGFAWSPSG